MEKEKSITELLLSKEAEGLEITAPLQMCIDAFFTPFIHTNQKYVKYREGKKKTKYFLMKRFLFTAYNNLLEIDLSVNSQKLRELNGNLKLVERHYINFKSQLDKPPELKYEEIFLSKQKEYREVERATTQKRTLSESYKAKAKAIEGKMEEIKLEIKKYRKGSEDYNKLLHSYKRLNGQSTDYYHKSAKLKEEAAYLYIFLKEFKDRFIEDFKEKFLSSGKTILVDIVEILDSIGYEFDRTMWSEAKKSHVVDRYFREANVVGELSSVTYLKYYLKSIDGSKASDKQKELKEVVKYLEQFGSKDIFFYGNKMTDLDKTKREVQALDRNYNVMVAVDTKQLIKEQKIKPSDLIVVYELDKAAMINMLKELRYYASVPILVVLSNPTFSKIDFVGKIGIKNIFIEGVEDYEELYHKIREIVS